MKRIFIATLLVCGITLVGASPAGAAALVPLAPAGSWGSDPMYATSPPADARVFVVERSGAIRIVENGVLQPTPFLTVPDVDAGPPGERGLSTMVFAPDYATSGLFYVFATILGTPTQLQVLEYKVSASNPNLADPASKQILLAQNLGATTHNGGQLLFGADGMLYITVGDNSNSADAQASGNIFGKVLRIKPNGGGTYSSPASNPFVSTVGARPEIWAYGLRNPFRASFAPDGRLIIADVGWNTAEELDVGASGANFGWPDCEGSCGTTGVVNPLFEYTHSDPAGSCAVIGGYVVTDPTLVGITGRYLYGDFCTASLRSISLDTPGGDYRQESLITNAGFSLNSFGQDAKGCVYVMADNTAYRVAANAGDSAACELALPAAGTTPATTRAAIRSTRLRTSRSGRVRVKLRCESAAACSGKVSLRSSKRLRTTGRFAKVSLGAVNYRSIAASRSFTVTIRMKRSQRALLKRRGKIRVVVTATTRSPKSTTRRSLNLFAAK